MPHLSVPVPGLRKLAVASTQANLSEQKESVLVDVICDASIVLKWLHDRGESEVTEARKLLAAHRSGRVTVSFLDLTFYEIGNVLARSLGWSADDIADQLDDLESICNVVIKPGRDERRAAAHLATRHSLSFYDSTYVAAAKNRSSELVTADQELLDKELGVSVTELAEKLGLTEAH